MGDYFPMGNFMEVNRYMTPEYDRKLRLVTGRIAELEAEVAALREAAETILEMYEWHMSDENPDSMTHSDAYYTLVKGQHKDWEKLKAAIDTAKGGGEL